MLRIWCAIMIYMTFSQVYGQIGGLSGTKLSVFHTGTVGKYVAELEPTYSATRFSNLERDNGNLIEDSLNISSSLCWRFTLGLSDKLEFGFNAPSNGSYASFSGKYMYYNKGFLSMAAMIGIGTPLGDQGYRYNSPSIDDVSVYGIGQIWTMALDSLTSIDVNIQYQNYFREAYSLPVYGESWPGGIPNLIIPAQKQTGHSWIISADVGTYTISDKVHCISGAIYNVNVIDNRWTAQLNAEAGISIEWSKNYAIVLAGNYSLWEKNLPASFGGSVTFTTIWR